MTDSFILAGDVSLVERAKELFEVDAGTSGVMIQDCRDGLVYPRFAWKHGCKVPKEDLLTLARYIGTLQDGVYVRNPHAAEVQAGEVNGDGR